MWPRSPRTLPRALLAGLLALLAGCVNTTYGSYQAAEAPPTARDRRVDYQISRALFDDPPSCAMVLPLQGTPSPEHGDILERALARQLSERLPRVIGPRERRALARRYGLEPGNPADWPSFARLTGCDALLDAALTEARDDYLLVWAERSLGLEAALIRIDDHEVLWRARHKVSRSDGGLPISPLSLAIEGADAARFTADDDILPSLADDLVRRIMVTLPNFR